MQKEANKKENKVLEKDKKTDIKTNNPRDAVEEIGGFEGPEPTRYGDWEKKGRCVDF